MNKAALLDVDGTLIDTNLLHVLAWRRAFERLGKEIEANRILHAIGMGGDRLVPAILGEVPDDVAEQASAFHAEEYVDTGLIEHARALPGAARLLEALRERGVRIALASSARREELDRLLAKLGPAAEHVDVIISKDDVSTTKPAPDIFAEALAALGRPAEAFVVGDTVYDILAAKQIGLPCLCVLTGGIERDVLEQAGAAAIYATPQALADDLDRALGSSRRAA
ncbi:HAD family hydrolase [Polyangium sp. 6x1]|uniref:HAD family hydrolase n=1 Tax=Polyangium sp. 6x1 TaxID=3042689 RepID=UPI002482F1D6|nr:HAD family hydrolase [Polyangium sp. 6x1]MDI1442744.1 HAD family hydrolase [Polyangium sp. 6x1]